MPVAGAFGVAELSLGGGALEDVLLSDDVPPEGAMLDEDELDGDDGGVDGRIDDDEESDGEGATTGGVVDGAFDASRWQPVAASTNPLHSSVINAYLIFISTSG